MVALAGLRYAAFVVPPGDACSAPMLHLVERDL
jgi:hypothetical protein